MSAVRDAAILRSLSGIAMRDAEGVLRTATVGRIRDGSNVLRAFFSSLSYSLSSTSVVGRANSAQPVAIQTQTVTASGVGGEPPYSYAWSRTDANLGTWTIDSPTSAATRFTGGNVDISESLTATFECEITDANGDSVTTEEVTAEVTNISSGGGFGPLP